MMTTKFETILRDTHTHSLSGDPDFDPFFPAKTGKNFSQFLV